MIVDGDSKAGNAKVFKTAYEMKLFKENKRLRSALAFYANANNWLSREMWSAEYGDCLKDDKSTVEHIYEGIKYFSEVGGKRAREVLKELNETK